MEESQQKERFWRCRLSNPKAVHLIAIVNPNGIRAPNALDPDSDWIGLVGLIGPREPEVEPQESASTSPWASSTALQQSLGTTSATPGMAVPNLSFHIVGAFTRLDWRRRGVGKALFHSALNAAEIEARRLGASTVRCTVFVESDNLPGRLLYEKAGFGVVGEELYTPRPTENGPRPERKALRMECLRVVTGA